MEAPLHLLKPDATHTALVCIPEALAALRAIEGPVVVCSLVGTQRQGKSSLLNLLHKRSCVPPGFGIGHYMDPKTHGLHFWSKPHPRSEDITVVYLDTEGLDAPHVDQFYNWTLSAVSLLISDVYMYQSKGSIDTNSIDRLAMILRVAEQLRGETSEGVRGVRGSSRHGGSRVEDLESKSTSEWQQQQQQVSDNSGSSFLWLLRDHQLNMKSSPRDEMIEKLDSAALRTVRRCFEDYDCVPLPVPVDGGAKELQGMDKMTLQDLGQDFREEFLVLERRILDRLRRPRMLGGTTVTGSMLADMLESFTAAVQRQDGAMADIAQLPTQREMLVTLAGDRAVKAGVSHYRESMQELFRLRAQDGMKDAVGQDDAVDVTKDEDTLDSEAELKDPHSRQHQDVDPNAVVIGQSELLNHHNACLRASKEVFDGIAMQVLDGDEGARFRHIMVEKIVGWGRTLSAEEDSGYSQGGRTVGSRTATRNTNAQGSTGDCLYRREVLQDDCIFGPMWRLNQRRLRARCLRVLGKLYSPLQQSLEKRIAASAKVLANVKAQSGRVSGSGRGVVAGGEPGITGETGAEDMERGEGSSGGDKNEESNKAITLLPTSEKFARALESIRSKFLRDKHVLETGTAVASRIFTKFQQDVMVPDSLRLVEALAKAESGAEIAALERRMQRELAFAIASVKKAAAEEVAAVKQTIAERDAEREAYKVAAAAKDEQRAAAIEAVQVAGEEGRSSLQRGIDEERGARDRLGAELRQSVQAVRDVSERFDAKLGKLQDRVDERLHGATDTCRKLVEKVRLESKASRESSAMDLRRALETKLDEATRAISASMDSKFEASAADAQASEAELSGKIDSVVQSAESAAERSRKQREEALAQMESKMSQAIAASREQEGNARTDAVQAVEKKVAKLLETIAAKVSADTKDAHGEVSNLKAFVTQQLADVGEGIAMTHTRVETLESAIGIEEDGDGSGDESSGGLSGKMTLLLTHIAALQEEQTGLKQTDAEMKALFAETLDTLRSSEIPEATSAACSVLRAELETVLRQAWTDDIQVKVAEMVAEQSPVKQADVDRVMASVTALESKTDEKAREMDMHLASFRKSLTDEIARELSECKLRIGQTERELQSTAQQVLADAATKDNLARVEAALEERIADIDGMLSDVSDSDNSSKASMQQEFAKVREEMIRRDQLLESQIVDAHAQLQNEAQAIVAPAKTHIASLRTQISSLNERVAIASETQGKQQAALNDHLKAELSTRIESLASIVGGLEEQKSSGAQAAKALELKLNKVYKALSREATRGREDREGLWGSLSELSCRISEIRAIVE